MTRTKEQILNTPPSEFPLAELEVQIDIRDTLRRIAAALEPQMTVKAARSSVWANKEKLVCPLCFKKHKNLKLHVLRKHNMTLEQANTITTK